jgi:hypothetical protein
VALNEARSKEDCPSVISLTLESFSIMSGFLLQDDPEPGGGGEGSILKRPLRSSLSQFRMI